MEQTRWEEINHLLGEALERPPGERRAWIKRRCADDSDLGREVEELLDAHDEAGDFLEVPPYTLAADYVQNMRAGALPRIGPYQPLRAIGRGGMGTVYLAARADGRFERQVALKVLRPDLDTEPLLRRFAQEQQVLAALSHSHIARLYNAGLTDAGLTDAGRPYLAMEYVEGRPIDCHCDEERLSTEERLRLFAAVAEAVQHAHQRLVVHRDLKPSNVLVTPEGAPKLLDFGIAKLLRAAEEDETAPLTRTGERWMTPEYAAPEQVRGEAISTATDVYALGVLLYKLLTGRRPFRLEGRTPGEVERAVCEEAPTRPSTAVTATGGKAPDEEDSSAEAIGRARRTTPGRLRKQLRGDLDTILLKALRKEPERRYASAEAFVEDIRRHLAGLPVKARPDTASYRARKFVRRHRWGVSVAAALVLLFGAFAAVYTARVTEERDRARAEAEKAEQTTQFLVNLFERGDPSSTAKDRNVEAALTMLEPAAERVKNTLDEAPEVKAELLHTLGVIYRKLGRRDRAEPMLRRALALRRSLHGAVHKDVAATLHELAFAVESSDSALAYLDAAVKMRRALFEGDHPDLAESLLFKAQKLPHEHPDKEPSFAEALAMLKRLHGPRSVEVADALSEFPLGLRDPERIEQMYREALSIYREQGSERTANAANTMHNLGLFLEGVYPERWEEGMRLLRRSYQINRAGAGSDYYNTSLMAINLAATLHEHERYEAADSLLRDALALRRKIMPDSSRGIAFALYWYGRNLIDLHRIEEAEAALREALAICEHLHAEPSTLVFFVQSYLGRSLSKRGRHLEAEHLLQQSYKEGVALWGTQHARTQRAAQRLVEFYDARGKPEKAAQYRDALAVASGGG